MSTRGQSVVEKLEVGLLEEALGRSDWILRVGDDNIVGGFVVCEELESVTDVDSDPRVAEDVGHVGKVCLGDTRDSLDNMLVGE